MGYLAVLLNTKMCRRTMPFCTRREAGVFTQADQLPCSPHDRMALSASIKRLPGLATMPIHAILTDIEGTTSSLSFVKDVLFPYARQHLPAFVDAHGHEPTVAALLRDAEQAAGNALDRPALVAQLLRWIDEDRKVTPLKSLQGLIWEAGYRAGDFQGHVYEDAARQLAAWQAVGIKLYVFSSGSVQAQKLLFAHTAFGDLTRLFSGYFDTHIGNKRETAAYQAITRAIGLLPEEILYLSDVGAELDAATDAGLHTTLLVRDGIPPVVTTHVMARNFDEVRFER
jgi:enolase-phosphatase E1